MMTSNIKPKININYARRRDDEDDDFDLDKSGVRKIVPKKEAYAGMELIMNGDKKELYKLLKSKSRILYAVNNDKFMNWLRKEGGEELASNLEFMADSYTDQFDKLDAEHKKELARRGIRYKLNEKILTSLSKAMESPAQEIFGAVLEAISDAGKERATLREEMEFQSKNASLDEINEFTPDEALFLTKSIPANKLKDIVGSDTFTAINDAASRSTVGDAAGLMDVKDRKNKPEDLSEKLEDGKVPNPDPKLDLIKSSNYYILDKETLAFKGEFKDKDSAEKVLKSLKEKKFNDQEYIINKGNTYRNKIREVYNKKSTPKSFSYTPKININYSYTIVRSYNLFSKISEFIKERFPVNFSGIEGKKILLNDGRYLKAKIVDEANFSVTSYVKDQKQFSVILPLKVHKFKWQNSIRDNIINK